MTKALTATQQKAVTIQDFLNKDTVKAQLKMALPSFLNADRFLRTFYTAILQTPKLLDCTRESMLSSLIKSAQLGLEPVMGKAALIPYGKEAQFQVMYRGLAELGMRSDKISRITAHCVRDKDTFDIEYGLEEKLVHKPFLDGERGEVKGAYTVWHYKDGTATHLYMPASDIDAIKEKARAWKRFKKDGTECPWNTHYGEMCKKTVVKRHSKLQPCSAEILRAIEYDNALETGDPLPNGIEKPEDIPMTREEKLTEKVKGQAEEGTKRECPKDGTQVTDDECDVCSTGKDGCPAWETQ